VLDSARCADNRSLGAVIGLFSSAPDFAVALKLMLRDPKLSDFTQARLTEFLSVPIDEAGSIRSTLMRHLKPWQNPQVQALTASSPHAIPVGDLRTKAMAVYLVLDTAQLEIFTPVIKLFLEQVNGVVNASYRKKDERKILFMIDEFYQLGKIKSIVNQLPFARDRDIRICLVSQGLAQLDETFGQAGREAIMAACTLQLYCGFNDRMTVEAVSNKTGARTLRYMTTSQGGWGFARDRRRTRSEHFVQAPLLRPDELYRWDRNKLLVLKASEPPAVIDKVLADRSARFRRLERWARNSDVAIPKLMDLKTQPQGAGSISAAAIARRKEKSSQLPLFDLQDRPLPSKSAGPVLASGYSLAQAEFRKSTAKEGDRIEHAHESSRQIKVAQVAEPANQTLALTDDDLAILERTKAMVVASDAIAAGIERSEGLEDQNFARGNLQLTKAKADELIKAIVA
jgi:hypothetical protein